MDFLPTILLVDEDPQVRSVMAARLRRLGYRVTEADSATAARAVVLRDPPTLILMDRGVPGDGQ
ncbi:MAG: response regulator, partial [Verrucomicrobiae bacterium]|nr:response regulator [Verrucomicrobiae bacterium]